MKKVISPNKQVYSLNNKPGYGGNQISMEKNTNYKLHQGR